jgi:hypothetical protein
VGDMAERLIVPSHDEVRHLLDLIHYDDHPKRVESAMFRHNKELLHKMIKEGKKEPCFIHNGFCEGQTEIHHYFVEYSAGTAVDWNLVQSLALINDPDEMPNLIPLCHKHHMGVGTGIHMVSFPAWIMQKFLNQKNIVLFETAIKHLKEVQHPNHEDKTHDDHHIVNAKAKAILSKLAS